MKINNEFTVSAPVEEGVGRYPGPGEGRALSAGGLDTGVRR